MPRARSAHLSYQAIDLALVTWTLILANQSLLLCMFDRQTAPNMGRNKNFGGVYLQVCSILGGVQWFVMLIGMLAMTWYNFFVQAGSSRSL
jgi:hypothetical protein